jgi:hypothetical protein
LADLRNLLLAPYEGGWLGREVIAVSVERPQGRELGGQPRSEELKDPLWSEEVL